MTAPEGQAPPEDGIVRSEEELHVGARLHDAGRVLVRKLVGERHDTQDVERQVEQAEVETTPAEEGDTGEVLTLPDGSLSIPVFEEEIVVEKRLVVRERIVLRKHTVAHREQVEADVRVERVEIVAEPQVSDRLDASADAQELIHAAPDPSSAAELPSNDRTAAVPRAAAPRGDRPAKARGPR